jgi:hypothetical protein
MQNKYFNQINNNHLAIAWLYILASLFCLLIYFYFFVLAGNHWSLMDDHAEVLKWGRGVASPLQQFIDYNRGLMQVGRFRPVDIAFRIFRYGVLPVEPYAFHLFQLGQSILTIFFIVLALRNYGYTAIQLLVFSFLYLTSLSFKEGLFYSTSAEVPAMMFLAASLYFNAKNKQLLAIILFVLSFLSKESFFLFAPIYFFLATEKSPAQTTAQKFKKVAPYTLVAAVFLVFIKSLPQMYTGGLSLSKIDARFLFAGLVHAPLKSLGPALLLLLALFKWRKISKSNRSVFLASCYAILVYTFLMMSWGFFDSWYYLHQPIALFWALLMSTLLGQKAFGQSVALILIPLYGFFATINGSANIIQFVSEAEKMATNMCLLKKSNPQITFYTNCDEAGHSISNYLIHQKVCSDYNPNFELERLNQTNYERLIKTTPAVFIVSDKCHYIPKEIKDALDNRDRFMPVYYKYWSLYYASGKEQGRSE